MVSTAASAERMFHSNSSPISKDTTDRDVFGILIDVERCLAKPYNILQARFYQQFRRFINQRAKRHLVKAFGAHLHAIAQAQAEDNPDTIPTDGPSRHGGSTTGRC